MDTTETDQKLAVLGAGSWGTTFAKVLADAAAQRSENITITLWARRAEVAENINRDHRNEQYLGDIALPESITATTDPLEAVTGADYVVLAVPSQQVREQIKKISHRLGENTVVISLIKGLERGSEASVRKICQQELRLPAERFAVVSGPNLALEIAREEPTATVVACTDAEVAQKIVGLCSSSYFRPYYSTDVTGVEIGGVVKNVIALAVGMCDGYGLGDNSKASIITRGLAETTRLAMALGAEQETLAGLAGLGDMVATCASPLSRNRSAGRLYGQGMTTDEVVAATSQVAEGVKSASSVVKMAHAVGVEMPISEAMAAMINGTISAHEIAGLLLGRDLKPEGVVAPYDHN